MADPTPLFLGKRLLDTGVVVTADLADDAVTNDKMADNAVSGDVVADLGITAGKLGLGAVSTFLNIATGQVLPYHIGIGTNAVSTSRALASSDVEDLLICTSSPTITCDDALATSGSAGWRLGQSCVILNNDSGTTTIAGGAGTFIVPNGATLNGLGASGVLTRVAADTWLFVKVAPVEDRYALTAGSAATNMAASTTYYWAGAFARQASTTPATRQLVIPVSGTITAVTIQSDQSVPGSGEAWPMYVRLNNTTDYLIESLESASGQRVWSNLAMSVPVAALDFIEIKTVTPAWATAPTSLVLGATIVIEAS